MKENFRSLLAGVMIGIGGIVYLSCDNRYVGAILFSVGLYAIIALKLNLFTGKVGYAIHDKDLAVHLPLIWGWNCIGSIITGRAITLPRAAPSLIEKATALCDAKLNDNLLSVFVLSCLCGALMFVAVEGYKRTSNPLIVIMAIAVFILSGFEHCVANMVYFTIANQWSWTALGYVGIMTLGNAAGSIGMSAICEEATV